jgi:hypothetical protein
VAASIFSERTPICRYYRLSAHCAVAVLFLSPQLPKANEAVTTQSSEPFAAEPENTHFKIAVARAMPLEQKPAPLALLHKAAELGHPYSTPRNSTRPGR